MCAACPASLSLDCFFILMTFGSTATIYGYHHHTTTTATANTATTTAIIRPLSTGSGT